MSTAAEILVRMAEAEKVTEKMRRHLAEHLIDPMVDHLIVRIYGRPVHAARARHLRRRGAIVRYVGRTSTGRALYRWMPRIDIRWGE